MSRAALFAAAVLSCFSGGAWPEEPVLSPARSYFTDTTLTNQNGERLRFYSDLLRGRVVVINTFFTTCTGICPPLNQRMARIQEWLGDRLGRDALLISISVDPARDTPERLKDYAARFHARPGWHFLTGPKDQVALVLRRLGQHAELPEDHTSVLLIGNDRSQLWKKARGLAPVDEVLKVVESVVNDG